VEAEWDLLGAEGFDALVVDECHHTTGQDPYRVVAERLRAPYRLGLTALVPPSRRSEIEEYIGEIRCWGWSHPELARYVPEWAAEVYEAPLNSEERRLYEAIEEAWERASGGLRALLGNALRWLSRDGAAALRDTLERSSRLREALGEAAGLAWSPRVREAHKLDALRRILLDHEGFTKAIVFVERLVIARIVARELSSVGVALLVGRRAGGRPAEALEEARKPSTRVVVATSAGEEGVDLPEADLLVLWSNTASPLRFVQRLGRLLRPRPGARQKYAAFIVTPDTVDADSLVDGIAEAQRLGVHVPIEPEVARGLVELTRRRRVLEVLYKAPATADMAARALGAPVARVEAALRWLAGRGYVGYIHTPLGRVYYPQDSVEQLYAMRAYRDYVTPRPSVRATIVPRCQGRRARAVRSAERERALERLSGLLRRCGELDGVTATALYMERGVVRTLNLRYNFRIRFQEVLRATVDNIYSAPALQP
jgi:superfamily II DNA or RNA helicase